MDETGKTFDSYNTLAKPCESKIKEKGSVFIAYAVPVKSAEDADNILNGWRKKYYDSTHIGWARKLGPPPDGEERSDDDGEPHGSTGPPILNAIKGADLWDVLVGVVRYYGGTKLGVGGLIRAYGGCAALALESAKIRTIEITSTLSVEVPHDRAGAVYALAEKAGAKVAQPEYTIDGLVIKATILTSHSENFIDSIREATAGRSKIIIQS
jgi:uncharacterized YigZ family protein